MSTEAAVSMPLAAGAEESVVALTSPVAGPGTTAPRVAMALARLRASRQAMRLELLPPQEPETGASAADSPLWNQWWRRLRRWAKRSAAVSVLVETLEQTWHVHPMRPVGEALAESYRTHVAPVLRKHPWAAVALAAGLGAALVASRRWHWPLLSQRLRPMPQRLGRWLLSQLSSAPVQSLLAGWLLINAKSASPAEPATAPTAAAGAAAD